MDIIKIPLKNYIHILDNQTNVTTLVEGPKNLPLQSNEVVALNITPFIQLRNNTYVKIQNPVIKDEQGNHVKESFGQIKLRWGEEEIRTSNDYKDPFPLYPGEKLILNVTPFDMIEANTQVKIQALRSFYDDIKKKDRQAGDQWMIRGPINLIPRIEVVVLEKINATIIKNNSAIKIQALRDTIDKHGNARKAGEQWLIRDPGAYLHSVDEIIVDANVQAYTLTDKVAISLRALNNFTDVYGKERKAGDEWLVTNEHKDLHILDVNEKLISKVSITVLTSRQYCIIQNPVVDGKVQFGKRILKRGESSFFLQPGETLEDNKVKNVIVLDENDALLLQANEPYEEDDKKYSPGDRWMLRGPREFVLPLELKIIQERKAIPLDENEGIYVRDISTGEVKTITGQNYLLSANEELWYKELDSVTESLIFGQYSGTSYATAEVDEKGNQTYSNQKKTEKKQVREKHRVVTFRSPQNSAVQVFNYKTLESRVVFGPELIKLGPHEEFTVLSLSGKKPKVENQIVNIPLLLGPDFMTDIIDVETKDHARLSLTLCYSWKFEVPSKDQTNKLFKVNDFIGDACKNLAAKIRGAVSTVQFETFHKNSASIVKSAVFGTDENGVSRNFLKFESNNLLIINVDIHTQEPIDSKTRENLSLSTNLSIQSQNAMQQADSEHRQKIITEENKGKLELQVLDDNTTSERQNIEYLKKKIETEVVKNTGEMKAKANATAKRFEIEGESMVLQSKMKVEAEEIEEMSILNQQELNIKEEMRKKEEIIDMELEKLRKLAQIEVEEFKKTVKAIGKETIVAMAKAGPEMQAKLLQSLGIKSFLITDGKNPINLFNTAKGVIKEK